MDEDTKRQFDALEKLRNAAFVSFNTRRSHEWKVSLTLWTALAALMGVVLTGRISVPGCGPVVLSSGVAAFLIALHVLFQKGLSRAQGNDRAIEYLHRDEMMRLAKMSFPPTMSQTLAVAARTTGTLSNWSHSFQVGVTILLAMSVVASVVVARR